MISTRQNSEINIQRLAAQRHLYSIAKAIHLVRFVLTIPTVLILAAIVAMLKSPSATQFLGLLKYDASWLLAIVSVGVFMLDQIVLEPVQQRRKSVAAAIQDEFDCDVLQIPWNEIELPHRPPPEEIIEHSKKRIRKHGRDDLINWYSCPEEALVPLYAQRAICQRSNVSWDATLRRRYITVLSVCGLIVSVVVFGLAATYDLSLRSFFVGVIAPLLPVLGFIVREVRQNLVTVGALDEIRGRLEQLWRAVLDSDSDDGVLLSKSRQLQDRIYTSRKSSPMIFDCFYKLFRGSQESVMITTSKQMSEQYLAQQTDLPDGGKARGA